MLLKLLKKLRGKGYSYNFNGVECTIPHELVVRASKLKDIKTNINGEESNIIIDETCDITVPMIIFMVHDIKQTIDKSWNEDKQLLDIKVTVTYKKGNIVEMEYNEFLLEFLNYNILTKFDLIY